MPNRVLFIIAVLLGGLAVQGCAITPEQMSRQNQEAHRLRIEALELQAREADARTRITTAQRRAAEQAGRRCTTAEVIDDNQFAGVNRQARTVCADQGVTVSNDQRLPPAARPVPPHAPHLPYGAGHQIPYARDNGSRPPGWYWGGGSYRQPGTYGNSCWNGHQWLHGPCLFLR